MPSWNIHTAIVERFLADNDAASLGIADENAFLFGNYVPDIYVGYMVPDATMRIDYCITHVAAIHSTPIPNADHFWDFCIARRAPQAPAGMSLTLGAWAHLVADRFYNGRFRGWCDAHETPSGDALRIAKQADFEVFGRSLVLSREVDVTPELRDAAWKFKPYRILGADVERAVKVASGIVRSGGAPSPDGSAYQLLDPAWMQGVLDDCAERLAVWLAAWRRLEVAGASCKASEVRQEAGLPPATPLDTSWLK